MIRAESVVPWQSVGLDFILLLLCVFVSLFFLQHLYNKLGETDDLCVSCSNCDFVYLRLESNVRVSETGPGLVQASANCGCCGRGSGGYRDPPKLGLWSIKWTRYLVIRAEPFICRSRPLEEVREAVILDFQEKNKKEKQSKKKTETLNQPHVLVEVLLAQILEAHYFQDLETGGLKQRRRWRRHSANGRLN